MIQVKICVGSSCHLKGAQTIVEMFQRAVETYQLGEQVVLSGSFCMGKCNRIGVTVAVDDVVHTGIVPETFHEFFRTHILNKLHIAPIVSS